MNILYLKVDDLVALDILFYEVVVIALLFSASI